MWVVVTRCDADESSLYASLLATVLRRGALPVNGEWGKTLTVLHGPLLPRLRQGTGKRVTLRVSREPGFSRIEAVLEQRLGDLYGVAAAALAVAAGLTAFTLPPAALASGIASGLLGIHSVLTSHVDANWVSSLLEEACMDARDYQGVLREHQCSVECEPVRQGHACSIKGLSTREVLAASLAILGFNVSGDTARSQSLRIRFWCEDGSCHLLYQGRGARKPTIETAILVTMLVAGLAC